MTDEPINEKPTPETDAEETAPDFGEFLDSMFAADNPRRFAMVNGNVLHEAVQFAESYMQARPVVLSEPGTDVELPGFVNAGGFVPIAEHQFDEFRDKPKRREGTALMLDVDSFCHHVNRFKDEHTLIFADNNRAAPTLTAVLDYHEAGAESDPRFGGHRTHFKFPLSDQWKAWAKMNAQGMTMQQFAHFLEDNIIDVADPAHIVAMQDSISPELHTAINQFGGLGALADPATLMMLANNLTVNEDAITSQQINLTSGEGGTQTSNRHQTSIAVPKMFALRIPCFVNGSNFTLFCRLRYRTAGGLTFSYEMWLANRTLDDAFNEVIEHVKVTTNTDVILGHPEAI